MKGLYSARHTMFRGEQVFLTKRIPIKVFSSFALCALLLVLLSTPQYLQMASFLGEELFGRGDEAGGALLFDLVLLDQTGFLGLDDLLSRPGTRLGGPVQVVSNVGRRKERAERTFWTPQRAWTS